MWRVSTGEGIKVAVIDSGVNPSTPSLSGQVLKGVDATKEAGGSTADLDGQGTTTAELIAGTGEGGSLRGLAPGAKIIPIRLPLLEHDEVPQVNDPLERAIRAAADSDAQIINISIGNQYPIGLDMMAQHTALEYALKKGKLLIAGTGDNADEGNKPQYPAAFPEVIGVATADRKGKVAGSSQFGQDVDFAAPGGGLPRWCDEKFESYCNDGGGATASTAITSASAALIWSKHPDWTANQVLRVLIDTAGRDWPKDKPSEYLGYGLIRPAPHLLKGKGDPGAADVDPLTNKKTPGIAPPTSLPPSPSSEESAKERRRESDEDVKAAGSSTNEKASEGDGQLWLILGAVAVVVVIGGGAFAMVRARRNV